MEDVNRAAEVGPAETSLTMMSLGRTARGFAWAMGG